jgi:hypothetical protein
MTIQQVRSVIAFLSVLLLRTPASNAVDETSVVTTVSVPGSGKPVVAKTDKEGAIHLVYDSENGPKYVKTSDGGLTFGTPISVVGEGSSKVGLEYSAWDMAVGKGGRVHVAMGTNAWKLKLPQDEWGLFYASLDPGAAAFSPARNINRKPSVAVWPTKGEIYFARLDNTGAPPPPAETKTPGTSGMRTGMLALSAPDGRTLVAWKKDGRMGWQLYDVEGRPSGPAGSAQSSGNGVAGVVGKDGRFILFR